MNKTTWIGCNKTHLYEELIAPLYDNVNKKIFDSKIDLPISFKPFVDFVYDFHKQSYDTWNDVNIDDTIHIQDNRKVLLSLSGGLDSIAQTLILRDRGYDVTCFYVDGLNTYENGQATKVCREFINKTGFKYVEYQCKKPKLGIYKQFWPENPIKNQMVYALMLDYCIDNNIRYISAGDALSSILATRFLGVNLTDCDQMTIRFFKAIEKYINVEFIPVDTYKYEKLQKIINNDLLDTYYPCVNAGRLNQFYHNKFQKKFNVVPKHLCGYCRKCCNSILLLHYMKYLELSQEALDHCWKKMVPNNKNQNTMDYEYNLTIPLEVRIQSLFEDMV